MHSLISENEGSLFAFRIIGPCLLWLIDKFGDLLESVPCVGGCLFGKNSDLHYHYQLLLLLLLKLKLKLLLLLLKLLLLLLLPVILPESVPMECECLVRTSFSVGAW